MANHKSAKTRINRNSKRSVINGARKSRVRTFVKKVERNRRRRFQNRGIRTDEIRPQGRFPDEQSRKNRFPFVEKDQSSLIRQIKKRGLLNHIPRKTTKGDVVSFVLKRRFLRNPGRLSGKRLSRNLITMFYKCSVVFYFVLCLIIS